MVFTSSQAETWRPLEESCCREVGRLQQQQHSTRMEEDTQHPELRIMQRWVGFYLKYCCPTALLQSGDLHLAGLAQQTHTQSAPWLAGFQRRWSTLDQVLPLLTRGRGCSPRGAGVGAAPTADTALLALEGPTGLHRYMQATNKVISSSSCSLSTDGGTPRAADYFWLAMSGCSFLSQLRWATALCCQPWEQVLLLRRTSSSPCCQHRGALCPAPGKDKLQTSAAQLYTSFIQGTSETLRVCFLDQRSCNLFITS